MAPAPRERPRRRPSTRARRSRQAAAELERIAAALREDGRPDDAEIVETGALMAARPAARRDAVAPP